MDYDKKFISIEQLKVRIAELVSLGRENEPECHNDSDAWDEYRELLSLQTAELALSYCWDQNSTMLINQDYWRDYCEEFAYEISLVKKGSVVADCIDWDKYARMVMLDYRPVWIGEHTFYVRN